MSGKLITQDKGVWFFLSGNHIQNCRSTEKIGRKEIILRFFFSLGIWHEKKNREVNIRDFFPNRFGFFPTLGLRRSLVDATPPPLQKCAGSKLLPALKILLLNQGTFLLHKFVDRKMQQKCVSTKMCKRPPALDKTFLQTSIGHFSVSAHFC